jgi:hypothetical protein
LSDPARFNLLQPIQVISFLLAHRDSFHPSALRLSRGTFYLAQTGTSHLAATFPQMALSEPNRKFLFPAK